MVLIEISQVRQFVIFIKGNFKPVVARGKALEFCAGAFNSLSDNTE
jgi:hypothetical protein